MTEDDLTTIVSRVETGEGLEAILADLGFDSAIATAWLKKHPSAKHQISQAKLSGNAARASQPVQ